MPIFNWVSLSLWASTALAVPHSSSKPYGYYARSPTVTIKNGTLEGVHSPEYNQDYFLGVPFAQPPVGPLRFRVPQSLNTSWIAPRAAKEYSAACVGYGSDDWPYPSLSEDCLYLNIIRPAGYGNQSLPVAFWIHGGGLQEGSGIDQRYNMSAMVKRSVEVGKPVVGVSVNYRLNMWGFVTGEEVVESGNANLGFRDQRIAMRWVQENVEAFGGDPSKVTIFGESAGALSVGFHLTAYGGRDDSLFRGAIMQSGNPISYNTLRYNPNNLLNASAQLGCGNSSAVLDCLRAIPFPTLNSWINSTAGLSLRWSPIIDHDFIRERTSLQLARGDFVKVPIISGTNSDEGTAFGPKPMNTTEQFSATVQGRNDFGFSLTRTQISQALAAYPANLTYGAVPTNQPSSYVPGPAQGPISRRSDAFFGDATMIAPRRKTCQTWSEFSIPAYCYRFNTIPHGIPAAIGATHFQEVAFVFNNKLGLGYGYPNISQNPFEGEPQSYFDLADTMSEAWVTFVHDGAPGGYWPKYAVGGNASVVGRNWVFDANVTGLGYVEKDAWRSEGIDLLNSWNADVFYR